jgi:hypothetical protein
MSRFDRERERERERERKRERERERERGPKLLAHEAPLSGPVYEALSY